MNTIIHEDIAAIAAINLPWENLRNKTILITGANGFLPAYLVETLLYLNTTLDMKISVLGLIRNIEKAVNRFSDYLENKYLKFIVQDVAAPPVNELLKNKIDIIIHAASQASPKFYGADPVGTLKANTLGTYNLLELARIQNTESFLFFSSGEVYGQVPPDKIPMTEDFYGFLDPMDVRSCYGESKRMAETLCVSYQHQFGVNVKIVRPFHTYGPGMSLDDGRVFADFVNDILCKRDIVMKSDGLARRAFCYLADATAGYFHVLLKGESGQAYNVGNDKGEISIVELAELLTSLYPELGLKTIRKPQNSTPGYIPSANNRTCPSIEKIQKLGWKPVVSVEDGFRRTISSFSAGH
jgi:UDP-glucuronate decarboxylase